MKEPVERRAHPRYHVGECGYLELVGERVKPRRREVYIADISGGGLGLHLEHALPDGATVKVVLTKCTITGVVVHCRPNDGGFIAGIRSDKAARHVEKVRAKPAPELNVQSASPSAVKEQVTFLGIRLRRRAALPLTPSCGSTRMS